jgi:hypothetical protein
MIIGIRIYFGIGLSSSSELFNLLTLFKIFFKPNTGRTCFSNPKSKKTGFTVILFNSPKKIKNSFSIYALFPPTTNRLIILGAQKELNK